MGCGSCENVFARASVVPRSSSPPEFDRRLRFGRLRRSRNVCCRSRLRPGAGSVASGPGWRWRVGSLCCCGHARRGGPRPGSPYRPEGAAMSGKHYTDQLKSFDRDHFYAPAEALGLVSGMAKAKFDESVDVSIRLGVDPRKADQMVRGTVALPSGTGKDVRVAVFAAGDKAQEARDAGADIVGADDLAAQVEAGQVRLRHRHRHPRHDAAGRASRPGPRAPWLDAQPEDRHRHDRRRSRRHRVQGWQGRVPHRPLRQRARARWARPPSPSRRWSRTSAP